LLQILLGEVCILQDFPALCTLLFDDDPAVSAVAARAVAEMGPRAHGPLLDYLEQVSTELPVAVVGLLGTVCNPRAVALLARGTVAHVEALQQIGDSHAIDALVELVQHGDVNESHDAAVALGYRGRDAAESVRRAFETGRVFNARLGDLLARTSGTAALPILGAALGHRRRTTREGAIEGLVTLGDDAVALLIRALASTNQDTRLATLQALARLRRDNTVGPILAAKAAAAADEQIAYLTALAAFSDLDALSALYAAFESENQAVRIAIIESLGRFRNFAALELLRRGLADADIAVRGAVLDALDAVALGLQQSHQVEPIAQILIAVLSGDQPLALRASQILKRHFWAMERVMRDELSSTSGLQRQRLESAINEAVAEREKWENVVAGAAPRRRKTLPSDWVGSPAVAEPITDAVRFSVTAPIAVRPAQSFVLDVWAHGPHADAEIVATAQDWYGAPRIHHRSKGPVALPRGAQMNVFLELSDLIVEAPVDTLLWMGSTANCSFESRVPSEAAPGMRTGTAHIYLGGLKIARLHFEIEIAASQSATVADLILSARRVRSAFASYASEDSAAVLARIQGMLKLLPELDIFLDVVSLRSGERWRERIEQEIPARDIFYLFWSLAASRSEWVDAEWRLALSLRGLEYIDPVPLVSPSLVPPPPELAALHFNDWSLQFWRASSGAS
jgi:HEAT repeat protein